MGYIVLAPFFRREKNEFLCNGPFDTVPDGRKTASCRVLHSSYVRHACVFFFFKQKTAYEMATCLEFRRVLFRSNPDVNASKRRYAIENCDHTFLLLAISHDFFGGVCHSSRCFIVNQKHYSSRNVLLL